MSAAPRKRPIMSCVVVLSIGPRWWRHPYDRALDATSRPNGVHVRPLASTLIVQEWLKMADSPPAEAACHRRSVRRRGAFTAKLRLGLGRGRRTSDSDSHSERETRHHVCEVLDGV